MKKNRRFKKGLYRFVLLLVIGLIIGTGVYSWIVGHVLHSFPMPFGIGSSVVLSGSMEPTMSTNDLVIVQRCDSYDVQDIVVYHSRNSMVIHRIIDIDGTLVTTKGDANNAADEPFDMDQICGKMVFRIPHAGNVVLAVKSLPGRAVLIVLAAILMEGSWKAEEREEQLKQEQLKQKISKLRKELDQKCEEGQKEDI